MHEEWKIDIISISHKWERKMRKIFSIVFLIMYVFAVSGCNSSNYNYNIEDDMGEIMDETTARLFDNISTIIIIDEVNNKEITIKDMNEIDSILQIIKNGKKKISKDIEWFRPTVHLYFYNDNSLNVTVDVSLYSKDGYSYIYIETINEDYIVYYVDTSNLEKWIKNYINIT